MGKNRNQMKPKASTKQQPHFANDQLGENAGYEELNQLKGKNKGK